MNLPEMADLPKKIVRTGYSHIAFSVGSVEIVDALTAELKADGYEVISGPQKMWEYLGGWKYRREKAI